MGLGGGVAIVVGGATDAAGTGSGTGWLVGLTVVRTGAAASTDAVARNDGVESSGRAMTTTAVMLASAIAAIAGAVFNVRRIGNSTRWNDRIVAATVTAIRMTSWSEISAASGCQRYKP